MGFNSAFKGLNRALGRPQNHAGHLVAKDTLAASCCSIRPSLNVAVERVITWMLFPAINMLHVSAYDRTFWRILSHKLM